MHHRMAGHRLLEIATVVLPIDERRQILGQDVLQILHRGHFKLVDLVGVEMDCPLRELRRVGIAVHLPVAPHQKGPGGNPDHLVMSRQLRPLDRELLALGSPFPNDIGHIQRMGRSADSDYSCNHNTDDDS